MKTIKEHEKYLGKHSGLYYTQTLLSGVRVKKWAVIFRDGSKTVATSKMERFVIIRLKAVNYYHKALHIGCCSSPRSTSDIDHVQFRMKFARIPGTVYLILLHKLLLSWSSNWSMCQQWLRSNKRWMRSIRQYIYVYVQSRIYWGWKKLHR